MANRWLNQFKKTFEKEVVSIYAHVTFGAAGAPTLDKPNSKGIVSITRNSAGTYTIVFGTKVGMLDSYFRLLRVSAFFDETGNSGTAPVAPLVYLTANNVTSPTVASIQVKFTNSTGTATDPASGEGVLLNIEMKNSNAP